MTKDPSPQERKLRELMQQMKPLDVDAKSLRRFIEDSKRTAKENEGKKTGIWVTLKRWLQWLRDDITGRNR